MKLQGTTVRDPSAVILVSDQSQDESRPPIVKSCPVCAGKMELVYSRNNQQVFACPDCHSGLSIPGTAWDVVRIKKQPKWFPKADRRKSPRNQR